MLSSFPRGKRLVIVFTKGPKQIWNFAEGKKYISLQGF